MKYDESQLEIKPLFSTWHTQVCTYNYKGFDFSERTYFPPIYSRRPIKVFYEIYTGKPVEFENGVIFESAYEKDLYFIAFEDFEDVINFLESNIFEKIYEKVMGEDNNENV